MTAPPVGEMRQVYNAQTLHVLRSNLIVANAAGRDFQADIRSGRTVQYYPGEISADTVSDRTRNADWAADTASGDISPVTFTVDQELETTSKIGYLDALQHPIDLVARVAEKAAYDTAAHIEDNVIAAVIAGASSGNTLDYGDGSNRINVNGDAIGADAPDYVLDAFDAVEVRAATSNVSGPSAMGNREINAILPPNLVSSLRRRMRELGNSIAFSEDAIRERDRIGAPPAGFVARIAGINCHVSNRIPTATKSSKTHQQAIFFTREAVQLATVPPVIQVATPQDFHDGPDYRIRRAQAWGRAVVDDTQLWLVRIRQQA